MEIKEFAKIILNEPSFEAKLLSPTKLFDRSPRSHGWRPPEFPARPPELGLTSQRNYEKFRLPDDQKLVDPKERGRLLHFFANHELLAIELMALMLLRFPEAPSAFRRGLVKTIAEEQSHLRLYKDRMEELGTSLGSEPINGFLWKCMATVDSLYQFVTHMSLTFEQANLDYCLFFENQFRRIGDPTTAQLLRQVYEDERGHVQFGIHWFDRWRPLEEDQWTCYKRTLRPPLSPRRAKGHQLFPKSREGLGLSDSFVESLSVYEASKGRSPTVYLFTPECELDIAAQRSYQPKKIVQEYMSSLAHLPFIAASHDDIIFVPKELPPTFLKTLKAAGFQLPEFITYEMKGNKKRLPPLPQRKIRRWLPWGWGPTATSLWEPYGSQCFEKPPAIAHNPEARKKIFSKWWGQEILEAFVHSHQPMSSLVDPQIIGRPCHSKAEADQHIQALHEKGFQRIVLKGPLGFSGQNMLIWDCNKKPQESFAASRLETFVEKQSLVVIEPWLERVIDFSLQIDIAVSGEVEFKGLSRFLVDRKGQYKGALVGNFNAGLTPSLRQFLYGAQPSPKWFSTMQREIANHVGEHLFAHGYYGPVGIDQFVYRKPQGGFALKPLVEINPRLNMGRLTWELGHQIAKRCTGFWLVGPKPSRELWQRWQSEAGNYPLRRTSTGLIEEGLLWLVPDPNQSSVVAALFVAKDYDKGRQKVVEWLPAMASSIPNCFG